MPSVHCSPGFSLPDLLTLPTGESNGSFQTSSSSSDGVVSQLLVTNLWTPIGKLCSSRSYIYERREVTRIHTYRVGQTLVESICTTVDENFVSRMGPQRVPCIGKTMGQRVCLESRCQEPKQFSVRHTTVTELVTRYPSPATD